MVSTSNPWLPTRFDVDGLAEVIRKYFDTLRNTYSFFALYANIDDVVGQAEKAGHPIETYLESKAGPPERFDSWIVSKYNSLVREVGGSFEDYEITKPVRAIQYFVIEELSNWYVRNNRRRFWAKGDDPSKMRAYLTLYRVLEGICRLSAPVTPFIAERIWLELLGEDRQKYGQPLSVHMASYPEADEALIDTELEETMDLVEKIVSLGRAARSRRNIKVRQPLAELIVDLPERVSFEKLDDDTAIILSELNIKKLSKADNLDQYVSYAAKLNFKTAGPKLGKQVKAVAEEISDLDSDAVRTFDSSGELTTDAAPGLTLSREEVEVVSLEKEGYAVEVDGQLTVALVVKVTEELLDEGFAREMVNKIQNMRKTTGLEVTDRITIRYSSGERLKVATSRYEEFIRRETLAEKIEYIDQTPFDGSTSWNVNGEAAEIAVVKA
jgi:isoleucyl-tRNA synthetase